MKCEICHTRDAAEAIRKVVDGKERELYVCHECAKKEHSSRHDGKRPRAGRDGRGVSVTVVGEGAQPPPGMIDALVHATVDFMNQLSGEVEKSRKCRSCGTAWKDVERTGLLGCPECWRTFAGRLGPILKRRQAKLEHVGKAPPGADGNRKSLERRLREAIRAEDYGEAGRIRNELNALDERESGDEAR